MALSPLDILFPKRCLGCARFGSYLCQRCFGKIEYVQKPVCPICQRQAIAGRTHPRCWGNFGLDGLVVACHYRGPVKVAIQKIKYKWAYDIAKLLLVILERNFWQFDLPDDSILVPIPLAPKRQKWRGFNQAQLLAKGLSEKFGQPSFDLLERRVETKTQVGLTKAQRKANVRGVFSLAKGKATVVQGKNFMLIDDVYTSGATMQEAAKVLKRASAKSVWGLAVALG